MISVDDLELTSVIGASIISLDIVGWELRITLSSGACLVVEMDGDGIQIERSGESKR